MPSLLLCCGNTHRQEPSALETGERGVCSHFLVCERVPSRAGSAACGRQQGRGKAPMQDAFAVRRMTCCSAFAANKNWHKILSGRQTPSLLLCCGNTHRREPRARSRHESALYPYLRYPHNACHIYRVRAGSAACKRQQSRGKAPMQDAFTVRRMTCCSAFAANKNWHKILSGRQTPSLLLCCGNTHRREPSARPRHAGGAYVRIPLCVKEFLRAQVRRLAGGVCLSDATTKKEGPGKKPRTYF